MDKLEERIFWMHRRQDDVLEYGYRELGYPFTMEQLHGIFDGQDSFDVDGFLTSGDTIKPHGGKFADNDTFTVQEVTSIEQLRCLMTWDGFDPWNDSVAVKKGPGLPYAGPGLPYPDFVDEDLRHPNYLCELTGHTCDSMPDEHYPNPTWDKYMKLLNLKSGYDAYDYSDKDCAMHEIQQVLNMDGVYGKLTVDVYNEILEEYGLTKYMIEDGMSRKDREEFGAGIDSIAAPETGMEA